MVEKKIFTVVLLGVIGTLIVIGAVKFLPLKKTFSPGHSATEHSTQQGPVEDITTEKQLTKILKKSHPMIIKFHATWCGACNYMKEPFAELAHELSDISFYEADVDNKDVMNYIDEHDVANVESLPTFVFFKKGKVIEQIVGGMKKEQLKKEIKQIFS